MNAGTLEAITSLTDLKPFVSVVAADEVNWSMFVRDEVAVVLFVGLFKLLPNGRPKFEFESVELFKPADDDE